MIGIVTPSDSFWISPSYEPLFVFLSYLIAVGASYAALDMTQRVTTATGRRRTTWLLGGAATMGFGIWSMHFTGMLAFRLPVATAGTYDAPLTLLSLGIACVTSGLALWIASRATMRTRDLISGGLAMGVGISSMHYLGMLAMRSPCVVSYAPLPFALSILIAIGASMLALRQAFCLRDDTLAAWGRHKVGSAVIMGLAITGMHYTGMASGRYIPMCGTGLSSFGLFDISGLGRAAIVIGTLSIMAVALISSYRERLRMQQAVVKERFLGILAHELRTPVASIIGYAEFLEDSLGGELTVAQREFVTQIQEAAQRVNRLTDDVLDVARLEAGMFRLIHQEDDLRTIVAEQVDSLAPQAREARVTLVTELPDEPLMVHVDPLRIGQVVLNLVGNAIKFSPPDSSVLVRVSRAEAGLKVEVRDQGPGIVKQHQARLFQKFYQIDTSNTRVHGGVGLGLAIAKSLVEQHAGRIGVESSPGEGSTFWFTVPMAVCRAARPKATATSGAL